MFLLNMPVQARWINHDIAVFTARYLAAAAARAVHAVHHPIIVDSKFLS
jgi:hypothetical protein